MDVFPYSEQISGFALLFVGGMNLDTLQKNNSGNPTGCRVECYAMAFHTQQITLITQYKTSVTMETECL